MNDCPNVEIRELLPEFVHRVLGEGDLVRVTAHVGSCADCRAELALLRSAAAALRVRPAVNVAAIVRALPAPPAAAAPRLVLEDAVRPIARETATPARRRGLARWSIAAAAAASIAVAVSSFEGFAPERQVPAAPVAAAIPSSAPPEGPTVLASAAPTEGTAAPVASEPAARVAVEPTRLAVSMAGGPSDLTDDELSRLIGDLDSLDGLPGAEPDESGDPLREGGEELQ